MAEDVRIQTLPDSGSPARVAYNLTHEIMNQERDSRQGKPDRKYTLDLYAECLEATQGHRDYE